MKPTHHLRNAGGEPPQSLWVTSSRGRGHPDEWQEGKGESSGKWRGMAAARRELIALIDMPICKLVTSTIA